MAAGKKKKRDQREKDDLPPPWNQIQGAIWLIGLAILAWKGWWWPGILVLLAVSGLSQAGIQLYLSHRNQSKAQEVIEQQLSTERGAWLPDICPNCGGPLSVATVHWTGPSTADCPYCKTNLKKPE